LACWYLFCTPRLHGVLSRLGMTLCGQPLRGLEAELVSAPAAMDSLNNTAFADAVIFGADLYFNEEDYKEEEEEGIDDDDDDDGSDVSDCDVEVWEGEDLVDDLDGAGWNGANWDEKGSGGSGGGGHPGRGGHQHQHISTTRESTLEEEIARLREQVRMLEDRAKGLEGELILSKRAVSRLLRGNRAASPPQVRVLS